MTGRHRHPAPQVQRWIDEPNRTLRALPTLAHHALSTIGHLTPILAVLVAGVFALVVLVARVRRWRLGRDARLVQIGIPPEVQPRGALLLWSALHDLLLPNPARLLTGQPHLSWEIAATEAGTVFQLWVPKVVPLGLIERAVESTWPGTSTSIQAIPRTAAQPQFVSELVIAGPDWFSLDTSMDPDPLRVILGQLSGLDEGENVLVQVLARPATASEQRRLRMTARRLRAGVPTGRAARAFELLSPNPPKRTTIDPTVNPDVRDVLDKSAGPLYRCLVRVAVCSPSRSLARGRLAGVIGGFAPYEGRAALRRRGVRRAAVKLDGRWLTRGAFTVSTPSLRRSLICQPTRRSPASCARAPARLPRRPA